MFLVNETFLLLIIVTNDFPVILMLSVHILHITIINVGYFVSKAVLILREEFFFFLKVTSRSIKSYKNLK